MTQNIRDTAEKILNKGVSVLLWLSLAIVVMLLSTIPWIIIMILIKYYNC